MFKSLLDTQYPRMLTQVCRDPNSPFHGCFDRNWWHYRIRDFASIMLQQGGYTLHRFASLENRKGDSEKLRILSRASAHFWNARAKRYGAFEEYYPFEQGYPPLAFSTLAMAKLVFEGVVDISEISQGLRKASRQLQSRFEHQAGNQQVAGLAALALIQKLHPDWVREERIQELKQKTLALQDDEGWFTEYDGPDLGYLSVTMDCLWDLFDVTGDPDYAASARKAFGYLHGFCFSRMGGAGMHNARNTDYIVPYGIARFLEVKEERQKSEALLNLLYSNVNDPSHFFHAIDDRYWCHYIGHSVVRAQELLEQLPAEQVEKMEQIAPENSMADSPVWPLEFSSPRAGYHFLDLPNSGYRLLISGKKGGIITLFSRESNLYNDFGWIIQRGKKQYVSHWWSNSWEVERMLATGGDRGKYPAGKDSNNPGNLKSSAEKIVITGALFPHSEKTSTPFLHLGLRVVSFLLGRRLTRLLRNLLIFKSGSGRIPYTRSVELTNEGVLITDSFKGLRPNMELIRAPRISKRHVASADSWHSEDFSTASLMPKEKIERSSGEARIETIVPLNL